MERYILQSLYVHMFLILPSFKKKPVRATCVRITSYFLLNLASRPDVYMNKNCKKKG